MINPGRKWPSERPRGSGALSWLVAGHAGGDVGSPRLFQGGGKREAHPSLRKPLGCFKKTQEAPEGLARLALPGGAPSSDSSGICIVSISGGLPGDRSGPALSVLRMVFFFSVEM